MERIFFIDCVKNRKLFIDKNKYSYFSLTYRLLIQGKSKNEATPNCKKKKDTTKTPKH